MASLAVGAWSLSSLVVGIGLERAAPDAAPAQSISMMPVSTGRGALVAVAVPAAERRRVGRARRGVAQARDGVDLDLADHAILVRDARAAVDADPQPQQRIGEAVALAIAGDQVDVLQPGQVVLGRARRAIEALRDAGQRQRLVDRQHVEDRLERAVAAGAVQPQLVAEAAARRQLAVGRHRRGEGADRVGGAAGAQLRQLAGEAADVAGVAVDEQADGLGEILRVVGRAAAERLQDGLGGRAARRARRRSGPARRR